jgi:hypothetical protein
MRTVLACLLLSGCSALDGIADSATNPAISQKIFLGGESITVKRRRDLDRYTCGREQLVCDFFGTVWQCSCGSAGFSRVYR